MKHLKIGTLATTLSLFTFSAFAAPYHYTFSGNIQYIEHDGAYLSYIDIDGDPATTTDNFQAGEVIEYTFLVDFDLPGFCSGPLGTSYSSTCTGVDIPDSEMANYFFTDLVSATKLAPPTEEGTTFNYGLSLSNLGSLVADSAVFIVSPYDIPVENWVAADETTAGTILIGTDAWAAPNGNSPYGRINSTLTLVSITPVVVEAPKKCKKGHYHEKYDNHHRDDNVESDDSHNDDDYYSYEKMYKSFDSDSHRMKKRGKHHKKHSKTKYRRDCREENHNDEDSDYDSNKGRSYDDDDSDHESKENHESNHDEYKEAHQHHASNESCPRHNKRNMKMRHKDRRLTLHKRD